MGEPGVIRKLSKEVVNRIAAGEIVQRPANALKELIENSLDAKSTNIIITVKAGGLKYLQIQDNGTGIRSADLPILCERFTTSKLQQYEDLRAISTYGFRGEALASISHIAHLTVLTKTHADKCAYKASYEDGKLKGPAKPCAGNTGTQITVEDLFYNVLARKKALRSPNEEYTHIMDVVGGYAIHNSHVAFTLKKFGENTDVKTPIKSTVVENVRIIHGNPIARELMPIECCEPNLKMNLQGYVTSVNYSHKKGTMLLFINHRMVDSTSIRKAVDSVYSTYLPKNAHSFVYLSLELDPKNVDVNVHPTKHEVQFLYEEQIIEKIKGCIESKLLSCNSTRVMYTQARLPGATIVEDVIKKTTNGTKEYAHNMVRVQADTQKIDKFFQVATKNVINANVAGKNDNNIGKLVGNDRNFVEYKEKDNSRNKIDIEDGMEIDTEDRRNEIESRIEIGKVNKDSREKVVDSRMEMHNVARDNIKIDTENRMEIDEFDFQENNHKISERTVNETQSNENSDVLENSIDQEPTEVINKMPEKWKSHTGTDRDNISYIDPKESFKTRKFKYERQETKLTSVKKLRIQVENQCNLNLREILANLIFIACIDCHRSLIQHSTKLYLCDTTKLTEELFYETMLYDFQNFGLIKLSNPLPLEELFVLGLNSTDDWNPELGDMHEMACEMTSLLKSKRAMLQEYFSFEVNADGELLALPLLLENHTPFMGALPTYLVRLVSEVNWEAEKECFDTFCRQTAIFYSQPNPDPSTEAVKSELWKQEHVIFPAVRRYFLPPSRFVNNGAILQIASLSDLYKVFERC